MSQIFNNTCNKTRFTRSKPLNSFVALYRLFHTESEVVSNSQNPFSPLAPNTAQSSVGIFWDLDNKPPKSVPPFEAAIKLKKSVSSFAVVKYMASYANSHAFNYVPEVVRDQRKERKLLNQLENKGAIKPIEPYLCRVCGRSFYTNDKFVNHFKQIHEREQKKRWSQIESAKGKKRVELIAKYSMKMEKYKRAARDVLTPKVGYGLAAELKRAGFWVRRVPDKPEAADVALREHMVYLMDKRRVDCLVLVSDDSDFVEVLKEAKLRCLKTVVVGDLNDGALKRVAGAGFSWRDILMGKAKKEAVSVIGKWKDREILKRLEWRYDPEVDKRGCDSDQEFEIESGDVDGVDGIPDGDDKDCMKKVYYGAWWQLESSDADADSSQS